MSSDPTPTTDQQLAHEEILKTMQAENGGELVREGGRLRLVHPARPPQPSR